MNDFAKPPPAPRKRRLRRDAIRNEKQLVAAVGTLLREAPAMATMQAVAEQAGLSLATAYRYFPTLDALNRRFMLSVIEELQQATADLHSTGTERFKDILRLWLDVLREYGPAMVHVSSREGFLTRLEAGEKHTNAIKAVWGSAISQMLDEEGISQRRLAFALGIFNSLVNSREILDLRATTSMTDEQLVSHLTAVYRGAIGGLGLDLYGTQHEPSSTARLV
ncbi:TetR family transcriptional regulator [Acrocarpospora pleiomorpha]|uniref:TetR family transcriptional regulator n=1 Tax=Acrocarpospora pleiomorpha TaxID=90975 RepID=A0A5M3XJ51_9ACTN|nr:TetR/AcrR family transcriptional regulator [Acrocarpospora pleiomorpha]GES20792.1 TetR family transcriptional regulator [Acrocarpospora pleiomorpha]